MKAVLHHEYGPPQVARVMDVPVPVPKENEVLIRVQAAGLNPLDWRFMMGEPRAMRVALGWSKPKDPRIGRDVAGVVETVGAKVTQFRPGQAVFGSGEGALAEYTCAPESKLAPKPDAMSFEEGASIPIAGYTALQALRGRFEPGARVLVIGAGGGVGTFSVQLAKHFGGHVTGVCGTDKVDLVRSIGAERVIDYTQEDFRKGGEQYDIVMDNAGNLSLQECRRILKPHGKCLLVGAPHSISMIKFIGEMVEGFLVSSLGSRKYLPVVARANQKDLVFIADLVVAGKLKPIIGRRYRLSESAEALQYLENGHAKGKVIVTMMDEVSSPS